MSQPDQKDLSSPVAKAFNAWLESEEFREFSDLATIGDAEHLKNRLINAFISGMHASADMACEIVNRNSKIANKP